MCVGVGGSFERQRVKFESKQAEKITKEGGRKYRFSISKHLLARSESIPIKMKHFKCDVFGERVSSLQHFICFGHIFSQWLMALSSQNTLTEITMHVLNVMQMQPKKRGWKQHRSYVKIRDNYGNYVNLDSFLPSETVFLIFSFLLLLFCLYVALRCGQFSSSASAMHTITRSRV